eukprot:Amastigsp_a840983_32.p1 type:complete len:317 gc:universal Amastigsp_a840983_32:1582-632(-)
MAALPTSPSSYDGRFYDGANGVLDAELHDDAAASMHTSGAAGGAASMEPAYGDLAAETVSFDEGGERSFGAAAMSLEDSQSGALAMQASARRKQKRFKAMNTDVAEVVVSKAWVEATFDGLVDPLAGDRIGPEGLVELLCALDERRGAPDYFLSSIAPLLLGWAVNAAHAGVFRFHEFMSFESLGVQSLDDLDSLLDTLLGRLESADAFTAFYKYVFASHARGRKSVPVETAVRLWNALLLNRFSSATLFVNEFMRVQLEQQKCSVINLDQWMLLPEFLANCDKPCWLLNFKFDAPWPVLFDDFVVFATEMNHMAG